jgi:hypothetical protein
MLSIEDNRMRWAKLETHILHVFSSNLGRESDDTETFHDPPEPLQQIHV